MKELLKQVEVLRARIVELEQAEAKIKSPPSEIAQPYRQLATNTEQLDKIVEQLSEGISLFDRDGRILRNNLAGRRILGWSDTANRYTNLLNYQADFNVRSTDGKPLPFEQWPASRAIRGESFTNQEIMFKAADGREKEASYSGFAIRGTDGQVEIAVNVYREVTQEKEANRLKDLFISIASHELRSPLTSIKGFAQLLQRNLKKRQVLEAENAALTNLLERDARAVHAVVSQTDVMAELISEMLDFSRIQTGRLELQPAPNVDVKDLVQRVVQTQQDKTSDHQIVLTAGAEPILAYCDTPRVEQVLNNLIYNALTHSPSHKPIEVRVELYNQPASAGTSGEVLVWVRDEGEGISPEQQPYIFDQFHRVRASQNQRTDGLGLSLFISRAIINKHGGQLWFESRVGAGSTFYFTLPQVAIIET